MHQKYKSLLQNKLIHKKNAVSSSCPSTHGSRSSWTYAFHLPLLRPNSEGPPWYQAQAQPRNISLQLFLAKLSALSCQIEETHQEIAEAVQYAKTFHNKKLEGNHNDVVVNVKCSLTLPETSIGVVEGLTWGDIPIEDCCHGGPQLRLLPHLLLLPVFGN